MTAVLSNLGSISLARHLWPGLIGNSSLSAFGRVPVIRPELAWFNSIFLKAHEKGGHFAPFESPNAIIADIRETFRTLR